MANLSNPSTANQALFGQLGCSFTNTDTQITPPTGMVIVAIQFLADTTFVELSPENGTSGKSFGNATNEKGNAASGGQVISTTGTHTSFPKGLTIYGRWESATIDADADGGIICYFA